MNQTDLKIINEVSALATTVFDKASTVTGTINDPKIVSCMLYRRLFNNYEGYLILWEHGLFVEADILLRSIIEGALCLSALSIAPDNFIKLLKSDAIYTMEQQIKIWKEIPDSELVSDGETKAEKMKKSLDILKPKKFAWRDLADIAGIPQLYDYHRRLSGVSSHVTGASLLDGLVGDFRSEELFKEQQKEQSTHHIKMAASTICYGSNGHAKTLGLIDETNEAFRLLQVLNAQPW